MLPFASICSFYFTLSLRIGRMLFPALQLLGAASIFGFFGLQLHHSNLCLSGHKNISPIVFVFTCILFFLQGCQSHLIGGHHNDLILTWLYVRNLKRLYFQIRLYSQVLGVKTSIYLLGGQFTTASKVGREPGECGILEAK